MIEVVVNIRSVAYSDGVKDDITKTHQQVDALQKRQDIANVHMDEVTRQNEAMNADLKQISPVIRSAIKAQDKNNKLLLQALTNGFTVRTDRVTTSVISDFQKLTGSTIDQFIQNSVVQAISNSINKAKQVNIRAGQINEQANKILKKLRELVQMFSFLLSVIVIELGVIVGVTIVAPHWWKLVGLIVTVGGSAIINYELKKKMKK